MQQFIIPALISFIGNTILTVIIVALHIMFCRKSKLYRKFVGRIVRWAEKKLEKAKKMAHEPE